jgi:hypothetical protein
MTWCFDLDKEDRDLWAGVAGAVFLRLIKEFSAEKTNPACSSSSSEN